MNKCFHVSSTVNLFVENTEMLAIEFVHNKNKIVC